MRKAAFVFLALIVSIMAVTDVSAVQTGSTFCFTAEGVRSCEWWSECPSSVPDTYSDTACSPYARDIRLLFAANPDLAVPEALVSGIELDDNGAANWPNPYMRYAERDALGNLVGFRELFNYSTLADLYAVDVRADVFDESDHFGLMTGNPAALPAVPSRARLRIVLENKVTGAFISETAYTYPLDGSDPVLPAGFGRSDFETGLGAIHVALGDFNEDGHPDMVTTNYSAGTNTVSILLGDGLGGFGPKTDFGTGLQPASVAVGDINRDGDLDLLVANWSGFNLSLLLGNGDGTFDAKVDFASGGRKISPQLVDLNGDDKLDIALTNWSTGRLQTMLGDGLGAFAAPSDHIMLAGAYSLALGDLDGDGKADAAIAYNNGANTQVSVALGNGTGGFGAKTDFTAGTGPIAIAVADVNSDGRMDLVAANNGSSSISVLLGDGLGAFAPKTDFPVNSAPSSVVITDFNGDGRPDVAVSNSTPGSTTVSILLGDGTGSFGPKTDVNVGSQSARLTAGDVTGDTRADLLVPNTGSSTVTVLLNGGTGDVVAVGEDAKTSGLQMTASPNPTTGRTSIAFTLPAEGPTTIDIYDVGGRRVHQWSWSSLPAGQHRVQWDGRTEDGRQIPPSVLFYHLRSGTLTLKNKMVHLQ